MPSPSLQHVLLSFGLTEKEGALYLASLSLGESGMTELAAEAGLNRSTAYLTFRSLEEKGVMGTFRNRSGARFRAISPQLLVSKAKEKVEVLEHSLPELRALLAKEDAAPKVSFYSGKQGYLTAANDSLQYPNSVIRHVGSLTEIYKVVSEEYDLKTYIPGRLKNNVAMKALYFEREVAHSKLKPNDLTQMRETRFLPQDYTFTSSTLIYGNKVAYCSAATELVTVIVESAELARAEEKKFDLLWDLLGR